MIEPDLDVNASMVKISTKSAPITLHSRLGAALIILAGGRRMEAMRTQSFTYANFRSVVRAVRKNFVQAVPNLKIGCEHR
jgi:hypothetical protein